jgi:hypothetical protein
MREAIVDHRELIDRGAGDRDAIPVGRPERPDKRRLRRPDVQPSFIGRKVAHLIVKHYSRRWTEEGSGEQ